MRVAVLSNDRSVTMTRVHSSARTVARVARSDTVPNRRPTMDFQRDGPFLFCPPVTNGVGLHFQFHSQRFCLQRAHASLKPTIYRPMLCQFSETADVVYSEVGFGQKLFEHGNLFDKSGIDYEAILECRCFFVMGRRNGSRRC